MNLLLLGSGGREHAFAWKLAQSKHCDKLFIAPGNAGTAQCGDNVEIAATDFNAIKNLCIDENIQLVIVGPEEPLVKGIVDFFGADEKLKNIPVIGPSAEGAQLEGSKAVAKRFMEKNNIPTAAYKEFDASNFQPGIEYIRQHQLPIVIKADGLAAGKGVVICQSHDEALNEFHSMIRESKFGDASKKVVIEQFLDGIELSVFVLTDGKNYVILPEAKDYKRIGEKDSGLNTGGMGAVSPVPFADEVFMQKVEERIIQPTIKGLQTDNINYRGFVFIGLIKVNNEPYVIEYNCRMGDPETEVVIPRIKNDFVELLIATSKQELDKVVIDKDDRVACTVMAVSGGYPGSYEKGFEIHGLDQTPPDDSIVFHAGTAKKDKATITSGGRVLCVTSFGSSIPEAVQKSRLTLAKLNFNKMYFRNDIGYEFMSGSSAT
jgi:phosphoribosylamine---glycine ligase